MIRETSSGFFCFLIRFLFVCLVGFFFKVPPSLQNANVQTEAQFSVYSCGGITHIIVCRVFTLVVLYICKCTSNTCFKNKLLFIGNSVFELPLPFQFSKSNFIVLGQIRTVSSVISFLPVLPAAQALKWLLKNIITRWNHKRWGP